MDFTAAQETELKAKLDANHVKDRTQAGRKLSYVEGWHVIAEANRIFGFGKWTRETLSIKVVAEKERKVGQQNPRDGWGVTYIATVRVTVGDVVRDGTGAGHGIDVDLGIAHESAIKEAETDAMKRAFMTFGNPFGLALYDKTQADVEKNGKPEEPKAPPADKPKTAPKTNGKAKPEWVQKVEARIAAAVDTNELQDIVAKDYAKDIAGTTESGRAYINQLVAKRTTDLSANPFM